MLEKIKSALGQIPDQLQEQVWFQQLKAKWEELDPQSRLYLQIATLASVVLVLFGTVGMSLYSVYSLRRDYQTKGELLSLLQSSNDELKRLREASPMPEGGGPWRSYFEGLGTNVGLDPTKLQVADEKPGNNSDVTTEALGDISLNKVNAKQLVKYATQVESGSRPVKLRTLYVDAEPDLSGLLNARLSVSGFEVAAAPVPPPEKPAGKDKH